MVPFSSLPKSLIFNKKSVVSFTWWSDSGTMGFKNWSTKAEMFSVRLLFADTIGLPGGGSFCEF